MNMIAFGGQHVHALRNVETTYVGSFQHLGGHVAWQADVCVEGRRIAELRGEVVYNAETETPFGAVAKDLHPKIDALDEQIPADRAYR